MTPEKLSRSKIIIDLSKTAADTYAYIKQDVGFVEIASTNENHGQTYQCSRTAACGSEGAVQS